MRGRFGGAWPITYGQSVTSEATELVWYAAYGSNCSAERFRAYLEGGTPPGATHVHRGARDPSAPLADSPISLPFDVCFRGHATTWGGAPAFLEHAPAAPGALGRRYLITLGQFEDVLAQENRLDAAPSVDPGRPVGDRQLVCDRPYGQVVTLAPVGGHPVLTFTSPLPPESREPASPSASYLGTIVRGLAAVHQLTDDEIGARLLGASGVSLGWDHASIVDLLGGADGAK